MTKSIRGWVYLMTNPAIPELVKIGYSTKDPVLRASELGGTGVPGAWEVAYDVLVENPRDVEQATHLALRNCHADKEFFKIGLVHAVATVKSVITDQGQVALLESEGDTLKQMRATTRQNVSKTTSDKLAPPRRPPSFAGNSHLVSCTGCQHRFSIAQIYAGERGSANCPVCGKLNFTPN